METEERGIETEETATGSCRDGARPPRVRNRARSNQMIDPELSFRSVRG